jgi:hypothetical protein
MKEECNTCMDGFTRCNLLPWAFIHLSCHEDKTPPPTQADVMPLMSDKMGLQVRRMICQGGNWESLLGIICGKQVLPWCRRWQKCSATVGRQLRLTQTCCRAWNKILHHVMGDEIVTRYTAWLPRRLFLCNERGDSPNSAYRLSRQLVWKAHVARQIHILWTESIISNLEFVAEPYTKLPVYLRSG